MNIKDERSCLNVKSFSDIPNNTIFSPVIAPERLFFKVNTDLHGKKWDCAIELSNGRFWPHDAKWFGEVTEVKAKVTARSPHTTFRELEPGDVFSVDAAEDVVYMKVDTSSVKEHDANAYIVFGGKFSYIFEDTRVTKLIGTVTVS